MDYAQQIYNKVFQKMMNTFKNKNNVHLYIIYISGLLRRDITESFLRKYNFRLQYKIKNGSLFLNRSIEIYKFITL